MNEKDGRHGAMSLIRIVSVDVEPIGDKQWVKVTFEGYQIWIPKMQDLGEIIRGICYCEDIKYPNGKGGRMLLELFLEVYDHGVLQDLSWPELENMYELRRQPKVRF